MAQDRDDLVRHIFDVPKIDFERVHEHFADAGRFRDQDRHIVAHGFERRDAKRLAHARHHIEVRHGKDSGNVTPAEETGEEHFVPDAECRRHLDHALRLVT